MPARVPPTAGLYALAAPVKVEPVEEVVVGPVGVLVAEPVVTVPLPGRPDAPPVPVTMLVVRLLDGQNVVVKVSVVVVEPVVIVVVPVEVVVVEPVAEVVDETVAEALEDELVEVGAELEEEEIGVQLGRVIVPLPQPPDAQITSQFLEQAASPAVGVLCQHAAKLTPRGG